MGIIKTKALFESELNHISEHIYNDFGSISLKSVDLAKAINKSIEKDLKQRNIEICDIKNHPIIINEILDAECEKLYLSINTIKTHNKRIYEKMNVSSRNELLVYIHMMKELDSKG